MPQSAQIFLAVGGILALGMATDMLGQRTFLPRVSLLVIVGVLVGPAALNLIPAPLLDDFDRGLSSWCVTTITRPTDPKPVVKEHAADET